MVEYKELALDDVFAAPSGSTRPEQLIETMQQASTWLDELRRFWLARLDRLERLLRETDKNHPNNKTRKDDGTDHD